MNDVTQILAAVKQGDAKAAEKLLPPRFRSVKNEPES